MNINQSNVKREAQLIKQNLKSGTTTLDLRHIAEGYRSEKANKYYCNELTYQISKVLANDTDLECKYDGDTLIITVLKTDKEDQTLIEEATTQLNSITANLISKLERTLNNSAINTTMIRRAYMNEAKELIEKFIEQTACDYLAKMRREAMRTAKQEMQKIVREDITGEKDLTTSSKMKQIDELLQLILSQPKGLQWKWLDEVKELTAQDKEEYKEFFIDEIVSRWEWIA